MFQLLTINLYHLRIHHLKFLLKSSSTIYFECEILHTRRWDFDYKKKGNGKRSDLSFRPEDRTMLYHRPNVEGRRRDVEDRFASFQGYIRGDREEEDGGLEKDLSSTLLRQRRDRESGEELKGLAEPMRKEVDSICVSGCLKLLPPEELEHLPPEELEHLNILERKDSSSPFKKLVYLSGADSSSPVSETVSVHCEFFNENLRFRILDEYKKYVQASTQKVCYVAFGMMLHSQRSKQRVIRLARILL
ncbi:hypothetical protein IGI04_019137 [Brassica rapa subsp. trilocularis]|uniref:Uncharacterized protein n=1 Tax=Brassica rapa subsp. trilocularis TaxID=1813537 RepID=A0ABQ7MEZ6_BRACM|nr:hypothetical protein IGI04_019137 [Brassica rapa subsp. trilocularis]